MRLPVVPDVSTKDGVSNKNARLINALKESNSRGDKAVVRPGLSLDVQASGIGNGLVSFNNTLVSVYGATLGEVVQSGTGIYGSWTRVTGVLPSGSLISATYGHGNFIATNGTSFFKSAGGISWTAVASPGTNGWALCSDGTNFIAVGVNDGKIYLSTDNAASWALVYTISAVLPLNSIPVHFDGTYFLVGIDDDDGNCGLVRSADGSSWSVVGSGLPDIGQITSFATGGGVTFAAIPTHDGWRSVDNGSTWTAATFDPDYITYGNGTFIGNYGNDIYETISGLLPSFVGTVPYGTVNLGISFDGSNFIYSTFGGYLNDGDYGISADASTWVIQSDSSGATAPISILSTGNGVVIAGNTSNEILVLNGFGTVINTLGTVTNERFDFAQSPL